MPSITSLSDDEILREVFMNKPNCSPLEIELAARLEYYIYKLNSHSIHTTEYIDTKRGLLWPKPPKPE
jgi:hypothetical protein